MIDNRDSLRERAEAGKQHGMELAANRRPDKVMAGKIAMLRALLLSPDGTATIDDATADLAAEFDDGGKWRGSVCRSLATAGLIRSVGQVKSMRPTRHCGFVTRWKLTDRRKAETMLSRLIAAQDVRLLTGDALQSETLPGATSGVSVQSTLPGFDRKESSNGQVD